MNCNKNLSGEEIVEIEHSALKYLYSVLDKYYDQPIKVCAICKKKISEYPTPFEVTFPKFIKMETIANPSKEHLKIFHDKCKNKFDKVKFF